MNRQVIRVDENGVAENGDTFDFTASPEAISCGYMVNVPVTLVFPNGKKVDTNQARVTPEGLAQLKVPSKEVS